MNPPGLCWHNTKPNANRRHSSLSYLSSYNQDATLTSNPGECKPKEYPPWENLIKRPKQPTY
jgi:hypothetical protein